MFVLKNYNTAPTFSSFLPGISGKMGIPIWSFYVNRGQGICSFGIEDKNHSIMEFYPAHQAYQFTSTNGFRTFIKVDGTYFEPFSSNNSEQNMYIDMNKLEIEDINLSKGIKTNITYYILPNENLGALVRQVKIKNITNKPINLEILDGMPAIMPYGVDLNAIKAMGQTTKAWMQVEDVEDYTPYYRVRVSMEDSAVVKKVDSGHFYYTIDDLGDKLPIIVDPKVVFDYDTSLLKAVGFENKSLKQLLQTKQICQNNLPCAFSASEINLNENEEYMLSTVIGKVNNKDEYKEFLNRINDKDYFNIKYKEAVTLTEEICDVIYTKTANNMFDDYCKQTFLDNVLRGGYPILLGDKVYHIYSRKHGDIERDYNFFKMLPEFYSQGNANFRDVNQNRRCDVYFTPYVKDYNIKTFYNLIQLDGCNPLSVNGAFFKLNDESVLSDIEDKEKLISILKNKFTPGNLLRFITENKIKLNIPVEEFLNKIIQASTQDMDANFGEGYWTDHWTYNLDLIESYLDIYPEEEENLIFNDNTYTYFESGAVIKPRKERYVLTENGVRQYNAVNHDIKHNVKHSKVQTQSGEVYTTNLFSKLIVLAMNKFSALDPHGMGIEMEGGKPGWYDALNGLPGIFGSSMAETYEVYRLFGFIQNILTKYNKEIKLFEEVSEFIHEINSCLEKYNSQTITEIDLWNEINNSKELYRERINFGIKGDEHTISSQTLLLIVEKCIKKLDTGIKKAMEYGKGIAPTYFAYEVEKYSIIEEKIVPEVFKPIIMPHFLEGSVRMFKITKDKTLLEELYNNVKASKLYDKKLNMYKVNASLKDASFEIGRAKAFVSGWLENESIWLHMEYKYLLEVLKSGLYKQYFEDLKSTCIPFLDPSIYGRSILENSSFIASSANPDESIHGRGFVARLSGSTAEFVNIWYIMMVGKNPFTTENGKLKLEFKPIIPEYLISDDNQVQFKFLGETLVTYKFNAKCDIIPNEYTIKNILITYKNGDKINIEKNYIEDNIAKDIRNNQVSNINIMIEKN